MNDDVDVSILFGDSGTVELRTIAFNRSGLDLYFHLDEDGQEFILAGPPQDIAHAELVESVRDVFEYLIGVIESDSLKESLESPNQA